MIHLSGIRIVAIAFAFQANFRGFEFHIPLNYKMKHTFKIGDIIYNIEMRETYGDYIQISFSCLSDIYQRVFCIEKSLVNDSDQYPLLFIIDHYDALKYIQKFYANRSFW